MAVDINAAIAAADEANRLSADIAKLLRDGKRKVGGVDAYTPAAKTVRKDEAIALRDLFQTQATAVVTSLTP